MTMLVLMFSAGIVHKEFSKSNSDHLHPIRYELDLEHHVNYIHFNPVKHGYAQKASD
ncbi:TPA: hypothetical protein JD791_000446 [Legionella pneumophila subsp. pneumophila]|nr:hypothetical protein [Legionella pneumophila subsp. pneumophila]